MARADDPAQAWSLERDLGDIFEGARDVWPSLRGAHILITGGTGFIGRWLLDSLRHADQALDLDVRVTILSRSPQAFAAKAPELAAYRGFELRAGDVTRFSTHDAGYTHVIHAATEASADLNENDPRTMFNTVVAGTRRVLDCAVENRCARVLFLSSGAVYGPQPWDMTHVPESWPGALAWTDPRATYGEAKRAAEMLCAIYGKQFGLPVTAARIFALLGPRLSLDIHFAAGNFIRDAIAGRPVIVRGAGAGHRSYIYVTDLAVWLWRMLVQAPAGTAYNVGSEESVSIRGLAELTARLLADGAFEVRGEDDKGWNLGRYVPSTQLARQELGLVTTVGLEEAIRRTALWNGWSHALG